MCVLKVHKSSLSNPILGNFSLGFSEFLCLRQDYSSPSHVLSPSTASILWVHRETSVDFYGYANLFYLMNFCFNGFLVSSSPELCADDPLWPENVHYSA